MKFTLKSKLSSIRIGVVSNFLNAIKVTKMQGVSEIERNREDNKNTAFKDRDDDDDRHCI